MFEDVRGAAGAWLDSYVAEDPSTLDFSVEEPWLRLPYYAHGQAQPGLRRSTRPSVRSIVVVGGGCLLLTTTDEYHELVFPGGGVDGDESDLDALARELEEETGYLLQPGSAQPFLSVDDYHNRADLGLSLRQSNRYFLCRANTGGAMHLDKFEARTGLRPQLCGLDEAIQTNESLLARKRLFWVERDTLALYLLRDRRDELGL
jgi:ADP-ribose pyrophosphatase YjhB (NUDIX family)